LIYFLFGILTNFPVTGTAPWVVRIAEIKASTAVNIEAERKVAQLNDEMQGLVRSLKTKDQNIQESVVKIELMERRMETVKKQADTIDDLASELSKARKQERAYEEAMEQLQADLDVLEQDNAKLKSMANGPERQGAFSS
jgi:dynactin 1